MFHFIGRLMKINRNLIRNINSLANINFISINKKRRIEMNLIAKNKKKNENNRLNKCFFDFFSESNN